MKTADLKPRGHVSPTGSTNGMFARRVLIAAGIIIALLLLILLVWYTIRILLLLFIGILIAVFLRGISEWVEGWLPLPGRFVLSMVILFLFGLLALSIALLSPRINEQIGKLGNELPRAIQQLVDKVESTIGLSSASTPQDLLGGVGGVFDKFSTFFSVTVEAIADAIIVFFVSLYLAFSSDLYIKGIIRLVPLSRRRYAHDLIHTLGFTLKRWLIGIFSMMVIVGLLSGLGLWILKIPLALTLGILAGLLTFIPYFGPVVSAIPAVLMALLVDVTHAVYVILLYTLIHIIEGYILSPLVQERAVFLPPILTLAAIAGMSVLLGIQGLIVATPLTAVCLVLVKKIYIEGILGDKMSDSI